MTDEENERLEKRRCKKYNKEKSKAGRRMKYPYNKEYVKLAQELRKNMTKEEKRLWFDFLKKLPITVNRQKNIGNYIVDFFIGSKKVVIELDGSQHGIEENRQADEKRDEDLKQLGLRVLRYKNSDINQSFDAVCNDIWKHLDLDEGKE